MVAPLLFLAMVIPLMTNDSSIVSFRRTQSLCNGCLKLYSKSILSRTSTVRWYCAVMYICVKYIHNGKGGRGFYSMKVRLQPGWQMRCQYHCRFHCGKFTAFARPKPFKSKGVSPPASRQIYAISHFLSLSVRFANTEVEVRERSADQIQAYKRENGCNGQSQQSNTDTNKWEGKINTTNEKGKEKNR